MSREFVQIPVEILGAHCGRGAINGKTVRVSALQVAIPEHECQITRYPMRMQITGTFQILCPDCGHITRHRLNWNTWKIRCRYRNCRAMLLFGIHGAVIRAPGRLKRKPIRPVDSAFPELAVIRWRSGEPINRIVYHP